MPGLLRGGDALVRGVAHHEQPQRGVTDVRVEVEHRAAARRPTPGTRGTSRSPTGCPPTSVSTFMSSTFSSVRAIVVWCSGRVGAIEKPQLPAITVVTPWNDDGVSAGSQNTCAS